MTYHLTLPPVLTISSSPVEYQWGPGTTLRPNINHTEGGTLHLAPCTLHLAPCTLHLAPCPLHLAPCTLHLQGLMYVEAEISTGEDGTERLIDTLSLIGHY